MTRGLFITIEGTDGSGKSTQARRLVDWLRWRGFAVVHTREPGGTSIAEAVRQVLLHPSSRIAPLTELFLYEAARAQHIDEIIRPALARGDVVVCERFTDATEAYQGWGRRLPRPAVRALNRIATGGLRPHLTLFLDAPVRGSLARARSLKKSLKVRGRRAAAGDRLERESLGFHRRVRQGYRALARREPRRIRVIPWRDGVDRVFDGLLRVVKRSLRRRGLRARR